MCRFTDMPAGMDAGGGAGDDCSSPADALRAAAPSAAAGGNNEAIITLMQTHHNQLMARLESWLAERDCRPNHPLPELYAGITTERHTLPVCRHATHATSRSCSSTEIQPACVQPSSGGIPTPTSPSTLGPGETSHPRLPSSVSIYSLSRLRSTRTAVNLSGSERTLTVRGTWQGALRWRVFAPRFEFLVSAMIVANSVAIAMEVEWVARFEEQAPWWFAMISLMFAAFFMVELVLRMLAEGPKHFFIEKDTKIILPPSANRSRAWNWFDFLLGMASSLEVFVLGGGGLVVNFRVIRIIRLFRITRLVRLVRFIRVVPFVCALRVLMVSIVSTLNSCVWAFVLLMAVFYLFAIVFTARVNDFFTADELDCVPMSQLDDDVCLIFKKYWGNVPRSMLTLFEAIFSGVDWNVAARPFIKLGAQWVLLFCFFIAFVFLAVLNTVTGAFVHGAIESVQRNREWLAQQLLHNKQQYVDSVKDQFVSMFEHLDTDALSLHEFEQHLDDPQVKAYFALLGMEPSDLYTLFHLLDSNGTNTLDAEQFVEGSMRLKGQARSIDVAKLLADSTHMAKRINNITAQLDACLQAVQALAGGSPVTCVPSGGGYSAGLGMQIPPRRARTGLQIATPSSHTGHWESLFYDQSEEQQQQWQPQQPPLERPQGVRADSNSTRYALPVTPRGGEVAGRHVLQGGPPESSGCRPPGPAEQQGNQAEPPESSGCPSQPAPTEPPGIQEHVNTGEGSEPIREGSEGYIYATDFSPLPVLPISSWSRSGRANGPGSQLQAAHRLARLVGEERLVSQAVNSL